MDRYIIIELKHERIRTFQFIYWLLKASVIDINLTTYALFVVVLFLTVVC